MKLLKFINIIVTLIFVMSCEENNTDGKFIIAGHESAEVYVQSYSPALDILIDVTETRFLPAEYYGELSIDLDNEEYDEIKFISTIGRDNLGTNIFTTTKKCEILSINDNVEIAIVETPLKQGDKISKDLNWRIVGPVVSENVIIGPVVLSLYEPETSGKEEIATNEWDTKSLYLAIRIKINNGYRFGWIGIFIDDYYDFKIREIGFER